MQKVPILSNLCGPELSFSLFGWLLFLLSFCIYFYLPNFIFNLRQTFFEQTDRLSASTEVLQQKSRAP